MDGPYKFPHPADVIAEEAARFRRLSGAERVNALMEMVEVAERQLATSPRREAILAQIEIDERAAQEAHRRVFQQHGH
jgi:ABC-type lipopolysaccharide export system ATPase subunit